MHIVDILYMHIVIFVITLIIGLIIFVASNFPPNPVSMIQISHDSAFK